MILLRLAIVMTLMAPDSVWITVRNDLRPKDKVQVFVDDASAPSCVSDNGDMACNISIEIGNHRLVMKRASDGATCATVGPPITSKDNKRTIKVKSCP